MIDAPAGEPETAAAELPDGLVCKACGGTDWKTTHTRRAMGCVRRWKTCMKCSHTIRTRETIEAEPHPDRDAA